MHKKRTAYILEKLFIRLEDSLKTLLKPVKCLSPLLIARENYFVIRKHLPPT